MPNTETQGPSYPEKLCLFAYLAATAGFAMELLLPLYDLIGQDLTVAGTTHLQYVILAFILGMFGGELAAGLGADRFGRRATLILGAGIFLLGTVMCLFAQSFGSLMMGRAVQGVGLGGQKIASRALIRDSFFGAELARFGSLVMSVFVVIPFLAPWLGQTLGELYGWRSAYAFLLLYSSLGLLWFTLRQPETLRAEHENRGGWASTWTATAAFMRNSHAVGYTVISGMVFGIHLAFISLAVIWLNDMHQIDRQFPLYFGLISLGFGGALWLNSQLVVRVGMVRLLNIGLAGLVLLGSILLSSAIWPLPLYLGVTLLFATLFCAGLSIGNLSALASAPLGGVAGLGSALISSLASLVAMLVAFLVGYFYQQSLLSLAVAMIIAGISSLIIHQLCQKSAVIPIFYSNQSP